MPSTMIGSVPFVVEPDKSRTAPIGILGEQVLVKTHSRDTGGRFAVCHFTIPERSGPPEHIHSNEDEWFYVLDGELTFLVDGKLVVAPAGTTVFGPRAVPHTFMNSGPGVARMLVMVTPGGFEDFFAAVDREVGAGAQPDPALFTGLMHQYGVTAVGPPIAAR